MASPSASIQRSSLARSIDIADAFNNAFGHHPDLSLSAVHVEGQLPLPGLLHRRSSEFSKEDRPVNIGGTASQEHVSTRLGSIETFPAGPASTNGAETPQDSPRSTPRRRLASRSSIKNLFRRSLPNLRPVSSLVSLASLRSKETSPLLYSTGSPKTSSKTKSSKVIPKITFTFVPKRYRKHRRGPSEPVVSNATKTRPPQHRRRSRSTPAPFVDKPLPSVPSDFASTVQSERPSSSIYSFALSPPYPTPQSDNHRNPVEDPYLRPGSTTIIQLQKDNPFLSEPERKMSASGAPDLDGNASNWPPKAISDGDTQPQPISSEAPKPDHAQTKDETKDLKATEPVLKEPANVESEPRTRTPPKLPHILTQLRRTSTPLTPPDEEDSVLKLTTASSKTDFKAGVSEVDWAQPEHQPQISNETSPNSSTSSPSTHTNDLEAENQRLRNSLAQSEAQYKLLAESITSNRNRNRNSVNTTHSHRSSAASTSTSVPTSSPTTPTSATSLSQSPRPLPPVTEELVLPSVPAVTDVLHPLAQQKYYDPMSTNLPASVRLVEALRRQEVDLVEKLGSVEQVMGRVFAAKENLEAGIKGLKWKRERLEREIGGGVV
ncbi:MAG: hypothetical protein M1820_010381 [Bogoriella megaspora]|nr:MAG: hypothetical protein M1820_010381 [Bogoriella megaspora]